MPIDSDEDDLWGSSNEWSSAITGASAQLLNLPGFSHRSDAVALRIAKEYLTRIRRRTTARTLYSGHALLPQRLEYLVAGRMVTLPLTALSPDKDFARSFARGEGEAVLFRFPKGTHAMKYSSEEWLTAGNFVVRSRRETVDPFWKTPLLTIELTQNQSARGQ